MGHNLAGSDTQQDAEPQTPRSEADAPPPPVSGPIPGPQPGFAPEHQHQHMPHQPNNMHYQQAPQAQYHDAPRFEADAPPPPVSGPIPGPQPGFAPEHQHQHMPQQPNNMHYQQAPEVQYQYHQQANYAPAPNQPTYDQFNQQGFNQAPGGPPVKPPYIHTPAPPPQVPTPSFSVPWTTGLFDCCDDPTNALITFCVPCVTFGQVAEIIDRGSTSCATHATMYSCVWFWICCPCLLSCSYRTKLRAKYELMESPAPDWLTHFVCELCALCQMHRELVNRGIDPTIGWHANVQRMVQQQQQMQPPMRQAMI